MTEPHIHVTVAIPIFRIPHRSEQGLPEHCAECGGTLDVTQPDAAEPDHLLGTCGDCGAWYVLAWQEWGEHGVMVRISQWEAYRAGLDEDRTAPRSE
jgi:hypothetical protein